MIRTVVFDLGNVLLFFDHGLILRRIKEHTDRPIDMQHDWKQMQPEFTRFETGQVEPGEFYRLFKDYFELQDSLTFDTFVSHWADIFWQNKDLVGMLPQLAKQVKLVMLSNTNRLHTDFAERQFPDVFEHFHEKVYSFEVGAAKPHRDIYRETLRRGEGEPDEFLYFDDIHGYVNASHEHGMNAHQYVSVGAVKDALVYHGITID